MLILKSELRLILANLPIPNVHCCYFSYSLGDFLSTLVNSKCFREKIWAQKCIHFDIPHVCAPLILYIYSRNVLPTNHIMLNITCNCSNCWGRLLNVNTIFQLVHRTVRRIWRNLGISKSLCSLMCDKQTSQAMFTFACFFRGTVEWAIMGKRLPKSNQSYFSDTSHINATTGDSYTNDNVGLDSVHERIKSPHKIKLRAIPYIMV